MTGKNKNRIKSSWRSKLFSLINGIVLTLLALLCILPLVNVLAISLSSNTAVTAGKVMFLPVDFTLKSYEYVAKREAFWRAMGITLSIGCSVKCAFVYHDGISTVKEKFEIS